MNILKVTALAFFISPALMARELATLDIDLNHFGEVTKQEDAENIIYSTERTNFSIYACSADLMREEIVAYFYKKANTYKALSWCKTERHIPSRGSVEARHKYTYTPAVAQLLFVKLEEKEKQQSSAGQSSE